MRHLAASVEDLNRWSHGPEIVVIIENKETAYALTSDHAGMVVLHGEGFDVATYASIGWVRTAPRILYWGDIDIPGLHFLDDLRGYGIPARSVMMDLPTLDQFRHLAVEGSTPIRHTVARLDAVEHELYRHLIEHAKASGRGLLLEQERIGWPHAERVLSCASDEPVWVQCGRLTCWRTSLPRRRRPAAWDVVLIALVAALQIKPGVVRILAPELLANRAPTRWLDLTREPTPHLDQPQSCPTRTPGHPRSPYDDNVAYTQ